jgi:hypothetical protein
MTKQARSHLAVMSPSRVLLTESADEFARLHHALKHEIKPQGAVMNFSVNDVAELMWEIRRYRRAKTTLINSGFRRALKNLLQQVCRGPGEAGFQIEALIERLAHQWFADDGRAKEQVLEKLAHFKLDEFAIEAEAMRIVASDLEKLDRLLASLEWRLTKALRLIAEFHGGFGRHLRARVERIIDGEVLALDAPSKKPAAPNRGH